MSDQIGKGEWKIGGWGLSAADPGCPRRQPISQAKGSVPHPRPAGFLRARSARPSLQPFLGTAALVLSLLCGACSRKAEPAAAETASDSQLASHGTIEVTAELIEIPEGAIFERDLYDYATILKYRVLQVHRGAVEGDTLYVGHYNPWKPRSEAADSRVRVVGGNLRRFEARQTQRMALEVPIDDHFMGGIVNKYFGQTTNALYWAVWTNEAKP